MPFINMMALPDLDVPVKTFQFRDPRLANRPAEEQYYEIRLRALDTPQATRAWEIADEMIARYITGDAVTNTPRASLPGYGSEIPTKTLIRMVAEIFVMQYPERQDQWQTFENLALLPKRLPHTWDGLRRFAIALNAEYDSQVEKKPGGEPAGKSEEPSTIPTNTRRSHGSIAAVSGESSNALSSSVDDGK